MIWTKNGEQVSSVIELAALQGALVDPQFHTHAAARADQPRIVRCVPPMQNTIVGGENGVYCLDRRAVAYILTGLTHMQEQGREGRTMW